MTTGSGEVGAAHAARTGGSTGGGTTLGGATGGVTGGVTGGATGGTTTGGVNTGGEITGDVGTGLDGESLPPPPPQAPSAKEIEVKANTFLMIGALVICSQPWPAQALAPADTLPCQRWFGLPRR